jgi:hypothetical protein
VLAQQSTKRQIHWGDVSVINTRPHTSRRLGFRAIGDPDILLRGGWRSRRSHHSHVIGIKSVSPAK